MASKAMFTLVDEVPKVVGRGRTSAYAELIAGLRALEPGSVALIPIDDEKKPNYVASLLRKNCPELKFSVRAGELFAETA